VSDKPEALTPPDNQVDAIERADGAEMFLDAVQLDEFLARNDHSPLRIMIAMRCSFPVITSCWL
jgi:hypothetical protein